MVVADKDSSLEWYVQPWNNLMARLMNPEILVIHDPFRFSIQSELLSMDCSIHIPFANEVIEKIIVKSPGTVT